MSRHDWLHRPPNPVRLDIVVDGELVGLAAVALRDADVDAANQAFAAGTDDTPEAKAERDEYRAYFFAAVGLGRENFESVDPAGIAAELRAKGIPQRSEISKIVNALIERYTATAEKIREAAKDSVRPTVSTGSPESV